MEVCSFTPLSSSISRNPFIFRPTINVTTNKRHGIPTKLQLLYCRAQASGITNKVGSEALESISKDAGNLVFVAGATGRVGSRTVRELLKLGFKVRAGVRDESRAESLMQILRQIKLNDASSGGNQSIEKLHIVDCDLEKPDQIIPALGKASTVICCIGASEKEIFDITGPYRIDYMATKNLIDAATIAKVDHFILLTSLGTNKFGFPAAILNLFWGVLCWKRKAEEALIASGLPYTIVRPGGMERPTDSYKLTHNITLSEEDTLFGGQVSNLQVAELIAFMAKNRRISYCKVLEVIAETTAPLTPMEDLLAKIPSKRIEIDPSKESGYAEEASPAVSEVSYEASTPAIVKETSPALTRPLSPYTAYEDLKPPTSPRPSRSSKTGDLKANLETLVPVTTTPAPGSAVESASLSPYPNYEDLKPARSPSVVEKDPPTSAPTSHSPYQAYEDLKPPCSPSPNAPITKQNGQNPSVTQDHSDLSNKYTLSPFTMYEDLKPPCSPSPNAQITKQNHTNLSNKYTLSPFTMYEDLKPPTSPSPSFREL